MDNYLGDTFERHYIECACDSPEHLLRIAYFSDEPDEIYLDTPLNFNYSFFKRIWLAIKYIFGYRSRYGFYQEFVLTPERVIGLRDELNKFLELNSQKDAKIE